MDYPVKIKLQIYLGAIFEGFMSSVGNIRLGAAQGWGRWGVFSSRMTAALSFEFLSHQRFLSGKAHSSCQPKLKANWFKRYNRKECPFFTNWDPVDSPYLPRYVYRFWQEIVLANTKWKTEINPKTKSFLREQSVSSPLNESWTDR